MRNILLRVMVSFSSLYSSLQSATVVTDQQKRRKKNSLTISIGMDIPYN